MLPRYTSLLKIDEKDGGDIVTKDLEDYFDAQIYSTIYVGSEKVPLEVIFDTGSNWLWVASRVCASCSIWAAKFDERNSTTFSYHPLMYDLHYGSGDAYGYNAHDQICLTEDTPCVKEYSFMTIAAANGLDGIQASGIAGMMPY